MNEGVWKSFGLTSTSSATGLRELRSQTFGLCSVTGEESSATGLRQAQSPGRKIVLITRSVL